MPDNIQGGFGANPMVALASAGNTISARVIQGPSKGVTSIEHIHVCGFQSSGVFSTTSYLPVFVVRTLNASVDQTALAAACRPDGAVAFGMPSPSQLATLSLELLFSGYVRVQAQGVPINFANGLLKAMAGQRLIVVVPTMIDASAVPASTIAGCIVGLTVLGRESGESVTRTLR